MRLGRCGRRERCPSKKGTDRYGFTDRKFAEHAAHPAGRPAAICAPRWPTKPAGAGVGTATGTGGAIPGRYPAVPEAVGSRVRRAPPQWVFSYRRTQIIHIMWNGRGFLTLATSV